MELSISRILEIQSIPVTEGDSRKRWWYPCTWALKERLGGGQAYESPCVITGLSGASPNLPFQDPTIRAPQGQLLMVGQGCAGTYGSHSSFRQRLPKPGLFRRTSASAASCSLPGWSKLDRMRGPYLTDRWLGQRDKRVNMQLDRHLPNDCYVLGMYTSHRMLSRGGYRFPEKGVCYSHMPSDLMAYHVHISTYLPILYFIFPHSWQSWLSTLDHLSQVAATLTSLWRAVQGPLPHGSLGSGKVKVPPSSLTWEPHNTWGWMMIFRDKSTHLKKVYCCPYIQGWRIKAGYSPKGGTMMESIRAKNTKVAGSTICWKINMAMWVLVGGM